MKKGTSRHPKMLNLARILGITRHAATGLLNDLWEWAGQYAPCGDIGRHNDAVIAEGVGWDKDPSELIKALVESDWLDPCKANRLVIHDWEEHCEAWVTKRVRRAGHEFVTAVPLDDCKAADNGCHCPPSSQTTATKSENVRDRLGKARQGRGSAEGGEKHTRDFWETVAADLPPPMRTDRLKAAWLDYEQHRRHKRSKMTELSARLQAKALAELNDEQRAIDAINTTIANGWTGIFDGGKPSGGASGAARNQSRADDRYRRERVEQGAEEVKPRRVSFTPKAEGGGREGAA